MMLYVLTSANERFPRTPDKISNPASGLRSQIYNESEVNDLNNEDGDYQPPYLFRSDDKRRPRNVIYILLPEIKRLPSVIPLLHTNFFLRFIIEKVIKNFRINLLYYNI